MALDVQTYRDASLAIMERCDVLLLTPGWNSSTGCIAEMNRWSELHGRPPSLTRMAWTPAGKHDLRETMGAWRSEMDGAVPVVYVAGPYTTGVGEEITTDVARHADRLMLEFPVGQPVDPRGFGGTARLAANQYNLAYWAGLVRQANGYPINPGADFLEILVGMGVERDG